MTLGWRNDRSACYRWGGPGPKCLRGAMGSAVAADGGMAMQCQDCRGPMSAVGSPTRTCWLDEPTCQNCHTGTATANDGQIRYTSALLEQESTWRSTRRLQDAARRARRPGSPYYFIGRPRWSPVLGVSRLHPRRGYPSSHQNDNVQSIALQGHVGTIAECVTFARHVADDEQRRSAPDGPNRRGVGQRPSRCGAGQSLPVPGLSPPGLPGHRAVAVLRRQGIRIVNPDGQSVTTNFTRR